MNDGSKQTVSEANGSLKEQLQQAKEAMRTCKDRRMFERYQTIMLHLQGKSVRQITEIVGRTFPTIQSYIRTYQADGLNGLVLRHSPGRPSLLTDEQKEQVRNLIVNHSPESVGFPAEMNWTSPLVRQWIKREWKIEYSDRGMRDLLYSLNFSFTTPTYTLKKADPEKQTEFKKILQTGKPSH